jgi:ABC-type multidrug transport system fused ATPase/permease subunit
MAFTIYQANDPGEASVRRLPALCLLALRLLWRAGRRELVLTLCLQALGAVGVLAVVLLGQRVVRDVLAADRAGHGLGGVTRDVAALALLTAVLRFGASVVRSLEQLLTELAGRYAQERILDVAGSVELAAFDQPGFHDRLARAQTGAFRAHQVVMGLVGLIGALASSVGAVAALVALQPLLAPLAVAALLPAAMVASKRGELYYRFAFGMTPRERERQYLAQLQTQRESAGEIRAYELTGFLRARHDRLYAERVAELRGVVRRELRWSLLADLVTALILAGTLLGLAALATSSTLDVPGAAAAAGAIVLFGQRTAFAGNVAGMLFESAIFLEDLASFLDLEPAPLPPGGAVGERVEARDVTFTYPGADRPALRDVSIHVEPGEVVALVGANGSGKSTLARLLAGLYVPERGTVHGRGVAATGVAFQDFLRYMLSARDNIAFGRHERHDDDAGVRTAARRSGAAHDLEPLSEGYESLLGPVFVGGTDLSGGQWQRVALARLFFRDAAFVILDEPTAALDAKAEHALFASIRELLAGRSVLLISHRFSSVREADRIYVLEDGAVVEHGSHEELVARDGLYTEMFSLQASAYRD